MSPHMLMVGSLRELHPKAPLLGIRMTLLFNMATFKNHKGIGMYDRVVGLPGRASEEEWVEMARAIHRVDPIDCIGGFAESVQDRAATIAGVLQLPFHKPDVIRLTRQKDAMRRALRDAGLDTTEATLVEGAAEIAVESFAAKHGYPFVLKPVDGGGSLAVSVIRAPAEIGPAVARFVRTAGKHRMLVEQFLEGEEYSVEAFSEAGQHRVICVTQKFKDAITFVETGHCVPAPIPETMRAQIATFVADVLTAIGIRDGVSHTEVIMTARGPQVVETHSRMGGDSIIELIDLATGVDIGAAWLRQCAGESVIDAIPVCASRHASIWFVTPQAVGTLAEVTGVDEISSLPGVVRVELLKQPGDAVTGEVNHSDERAAFVIATGNTAEEAVTRAREAARRIRFVVSCSG